MKLPPHPPISRLPLLLAAIVAGCMLILQIHNASIYPPTHGFDAGDHIAYIGMIKSDLSIPLPDAGGETDQPPLYYLLMSMLPTLKSIQYAGVLMWSMTISCIGYWLWSRRSRSLSAILILTLALTLPAILVQTPQVSNELMATMLITCVLALWRDQPTPRRLLLLGALTGLALSTKVTGLILAAAITMTLYTQRKTLAQFVRFTLVYLVPVLILGGWYYLRNYSLYGRLFIDTLDFAGTTLSQPIVARDLGFLLNPLSILSLDVYRAQHYSMLGGTYFSLFGDGHSVITPVQQYSKAAAALAAVSSGWIILVVRGVIRDVRERRITLYAIYTILLVAGYIYFNFKLPYYSSVKGTYLTSLVLPMGYYISRAHLPTSRRGMLILGIFVTVYLTLIIKNFWVMEWWYGA